MYAVTDAYLQAMDQPVREPVTMGLRLYNLDLDGQASVECTSETDQDICTAADIGILTADKPRKAALERDWMRADGSYTLDPVSYWIGEALSDAAAQDGWYPRSAPVDELVIHTGSIPYIGNITLLLDGADAQAVVETVRHVHIGMTSQAWASVDTYTSHDGLLVFPCATLEGAPDYMQDALGRTPDEIRIQFTALSAPQQRPKVLAVCVGDMTVIPDGGILSLRYTDTNDGLCLELPGKRLQCDVQYDGWESLMYDEDLDSKYPLWSTQATVWLDYAGQRVPLGHFYTRQPVVVRGGLRLELYDAVEPLNDAVHWWSRADKEAGYSLSERMQEVMRVDRTILLDPNGVGGDPVRTYAQHLGITLDTGNAANRTALSVNPCPPISGAQALQLYANLSGNVLRSVRDGTGLEARSIPIDATPVRQISYDWLYDNPEVTHEGGITLSVTGQYLGAPEPKSVQDGHVDFYAEAPNVVTHAKPTKNVQCTFGADAYTAPDWYWYISYMGAQKDGDMTSDTAIAQVYPMHETYTRQRGAGGRSVDVSNPLLCGTDGFTLDGYQDRIYAELQHPILMTVSHRGYPEIDAGDIVSIQTQRDGPYIKARVLENSLSYKAGALRGTTKVRLLE